jgi:hypothetical protein
VATLQIGGNTLAERKPQEVKYYRGWPLAILHALKLLADAAHGAELHRCAHSHAGPYALTDSAAHCPYYVG